MGIKAKVFGLAERGLIPDALVRAGIRNMSQETGAAARCATPEEREERMSKWVEQMDESPIALAPVESNEQHYEVPSAFFGEVLVHTVNTPALTGIKAPRA